jgi:hypothetical protein
MTRSVRDASPVDLSHYPALSFEGLELRANYRLISFREDVLQALEQKEAAAIIVQILWRWHEYLHDELLEKIEQRSKTGSPPFTSGEIEDRMWVYMSYARFVRESGGALGYNTVIRTLEYLVDTKKVVERRPNHNPNTIEYADYEYRINRTALRDLLKTLPAAPRRFTKKGKSAPGEAAGQMDTFSAPPSPQMGISCDELSSTACSSPQMGMSPQMGTCSTHLGTPSPQMGRPTAQEGTAYYPDGQTIQSILQDSLQESLQQQQQQQQKAGDHASESSAAAVAHFSFDLQSLTSDEIALIQVYRQQRQHGEQAGIQKPAPAQVIAEEDFPFVQRADTPMSEVANLDTPDAPMSEAHPERDVTDETNQAPVRQAETEQPATACPGDAEEAVFGVAANTHQSIAPPLEQTLSTRVGEGTPPLPPGQQASSPDAEPALTPEAIVTLFERLQKHPYDRVARAMQLAAAPILLELDRTGQLALPLTERLLVRVYDEQSNDPYWKRTHGTLDVTDLVGREKSGQIRIVRWIARYIPPTRRARTGATVTPTPEQRAGQRPIIGVSGFPIFQPSKTPMKVLPPPPPAHRPGIHLAVAARGV